MILNGTGFSIGSTDPIDDRLIKTKAEMLATNDDIMPDVYICLCKDDGQLYTYNKTNTANAETGKFKLNASEVEALLQYSGFLYNPYTPTQEPVVGDKFLVYDSFFNRTPKKGETCVSLYLDCRTGWQYYVKVEVDIRTGNKIYLVIKEVISCISSEMSLNVKRKVTAGTYNMINKYMYFLITETDTNASVTFTLPEATEKKDFDKIIVIENPNNIPIIFPTNVIWLNKEPKSCEGFTFIQVMRTYGNDIKWIGRIYQENDKGELNTALIKDSVVTPQEGINYVDMITNTTINLPVVDKYTEIRLWFKCTEDLSIVFPEVCWQNEPETYAGYIYEYIFTYIPNLNEWVGGFVSYELPTV